MNGELCIELHRLRHAILGARDRGRVVIEFTDGPTSEVDAAVARHLADAMLALVNLPTLGPHWRAVDRARAVAVLAAVLHEDLELERPRVPQKVALMLAERVATAFREPPVFLTNVRTTADLAQSPHKWASGHQSTELDAGVAIVSGDLVGLVWVEDRP